MEVNLTPEQTDVVRHAVDAGRVSDPEQAVQQAMSLWVERERKRAEFLASLDEAEVSIARGEGTPITKESTKKLAQDVMARCRARIDAEQAARA